MVRGGDAGEVDAGPPGQGARQRGMKLRGSGAGAGLGFAEGQAGGHPGGGELADGEGARGIFGGEPGGKFIGALGAIVEEIAGLNDDFFLWQLGELEGALFAIHFEPEIPWLESGLGLGELAMFEGIGHGGMFAKRPKLAVVEKGDFHGKYYLGRGVQMTQQHQAAAPNKPMAII